MSWSSPTPCTSQASATTVGTPRSIRCRPARARGAVEREDQPQTLGTSPHALSLELERRAGSKPVAPRIGLEGPSRTYASPRMRSRTQVRAGRSRALLSPLAPGALPESWRKEDLSITYLHALAATIGVTCDHSERDINGWDVHLAAKDTAMADALQLKVQLKCTVRRLRRLSAGEWISATPDQLLVRARAWWTSLIGAGPLPADQMTCTVRIPSGKRLTPQSLLQNMRSCP